MLFLKSREPLPLTLEKDTGVLSAKRGDRRVSLAFPSSQLPLAPNRLCVF